MLDLTFHFASISFATVWAILLPGQDWKIIWLELGVMNGVVKGGREFSEVSSDRRRKQEEKAAAGLECSNFRPAARAMTCAAFPPIISQTVSVARSRICVKSFLCSQSASQLSTTPWVKCCRKSSPWWSPEKYLSPESPLAELPVFLLRVCESLIRGWVGGTLEQEDEVLSRQAPGLPAGHHVVVFQEVSLIFFFGSLAPPARSNRHTHYYRHNKMSVVTAILADSWDHHVRTARESYSKDRTSSQGLQDEIRVHKMPQKPICLR